MAGGRPLIPLDWEKIDAFLEAGSKGSEVAAHFHISPDTLYRRVETEFNMSFTDYAFEKCQKGESLLKFKQFKIAMKGNVTMLIWLGKVRLGQKEPDSISINSPLELDITKDHMIMELQDKLTKYETNADEPKTE